MWAPIFNTFNYKNILKAASLSFCLLIIPSAAFGDDGSVASSLFKEISNSNTIKIFPLFRSITFPSWLTVHLFMLLITASLMLAVFFYAARKASLQPKGILVAVEGVILFVKDDIVFPVMGKERGEKWLPFFCTLFVFILTANFLGLIPAFKTATGNINITTALALMILFLIFAVGIGNLGIKKFFINFYPEGTAWPVGLFVAFLEFIGLFIKTFVLSLRLFANMFAGHLAIISFLVLIFVLRPLVGIISVPFSIFTYLLEVLIGFIQALVFVLLSCIFITLASSMHDS